MLDTERESLMAQREIAHDVFLYEGVEWRRCEKEALGLIVSYSEPRVKEVPYPTATDDTRENFRLHFEWVEKIEAIKNRAQYQVDVMMLYGEAKEHSKMRDDAYREVGRIDEILKEDSELL